MMKVAVVKVVAAVGAAVMIAGVLGVGMLLRGADVPGGGTAQTRPVATRPGQQQLLGEIRQRDSAQRRTEALAEVKAMLERDASAQARALVVIAQIADIKVDRSGLLEKVEALLASPDPVVRRTALSALPSLEPGERQLEAVAKLAKDSDAQVRAGVMAAYVGVRRGLKMTAAVEEPALMLLGDKEKTVVIATGQRLWSVPLSDAVEEKVIALSRFGADEKPNSGSVEYCMMYFVLSTRPTVSNRMAQRLAEIARHPLLDQDWTGRAVWGMAHQLSKEAADTVTKAMVEELDNSLVAYNREWAVRALTQADTQAAKEKLRKMAAEDESPALRELAGRAVPKSAPVSP